MTFIESLLWPASLLYGGGAKIREWSYRRGLRKQNRLSGTVISVGNLTVGGTGKTPMVCWLAERAVVEKKHIGILTRGYRGSGDSSDEVDLLRRRLADSVAIAIGANRYGKGRELEARGAQWFILDDGFQHLQLARDADIVLIDAANPFGGGHLLPAGRLREPISALRRADVVVITRSDHAPAVASIVRRYSTAPIYYAQTKLAGIAAVPGSKAAASCETDFVDWRGKKVFVFCGIGNPKAFLADLNRWRIQVAGSMVFRDHHRYSQPEMTEIERRARDAGADALLCTEKDIFNLSAVRASEFPLAYCLISLVPNDPERFWCEVVSIADSRCGGAAQ
ncbi:MAG TPA: tetraacyldisaccharide 4'-kinase [Candidatus Acidoferrales bacterium]|nr:tetraacyldisaccharide 4'-kinase [Candidatus Acidoferrales bacterium]